MFSANFSSKYNKKMTNKQNIFRPPLSKAFQYDSFIVPHSCLTQHRRLSASPSILFHPYSISPRDIYLRLYLPRRLMNIHRRGEFGPWITCRSCSSAHAKWVQSLPDLVTLSLVLVSIYAVEIIYLMERQKLDSSSLMSIFFNFAKARTRLELGYR